MVKNNIIWLTFIISLAYTSILEQSRGLLEDNDDIITEFDQAEEIDPSEDQDLNDLDESLVDEVLKAEESVPDEHEVVESLPEEPIEDIPEIEEFPFLIYHKEHEFGGMNVTIPYKEKVIKYLDELDKEAEEIGAVNTIKFTSDNKLIGYNTDTYGFQKSIEPLLKKHHTKALILGTGGASKAIAFTFKKLNIDHQHTYIYKQI